jgi:hypothetical protein
MDFARPRFGCVEMEPPVRTGRTGNHNASFYAPYVYQCVCCPGQQRERIPVHLWRNAVLRRHLGEVYYEQPRSGADNCRGNRFWGAYYSVYAKLVRNCANNNCAIPVVLFPAVVFRGNRQCVHCTQRSLIMHFKKKVMWRISGGGRYPHRVCGL